MRGIGVKAVWLWIKLWITCWVCEKIETGGLGLQGGKVVISMLSLRGFMIRVLSLGVGVVLLMVSLKEEE